MTFTLILVLLGGVGGQTTNCRWIGSTWNCDTPQQQPGIDWRNAPRPDPRATENLYDTMQRAQADRAAREQENAARAQDGQRRALYAKVGQLISAGDCPSAIRLGLEAGDFDLVSKVKDFCK